jgi:hypothetical protein
MRVLLCGLLFLAAVFLTGCETTDAQNTSSRPWGYRGGYDPGFPSMFNEGR